MALLFDASGEEVDHGSGASLDNITVGTMAVWMWFNSGVTGTNGLKIMEKGGNFGLIWDGTGANWGLDFFILRATSALVVKPLDEDMPAFGEQKWLYIVVRWDTGGADADQDMYSGDLDTLAAEVTYDTQSVGSGAANDNAADSLMVGNNAAGTQALDGRIAWYGLWTSYLSLAEIHEQQFRTHRPVDAANSVLFAHYGLHGGTSTVPDRSGSGNDGTVTNATVAPHAPVPVLTNQMIVPLEAAAAPAAPTGLFVGGLTAMGAGR